MRARLLLAALAATVAAGLLASAAPAIDLFIYGTVKSRVPGANEATVAVRWDFKCLGGKLGEAEYEFTIVAVRTKPAPGAKVTIRSDTTQKGSTTARLPAGTWQLRADPFLCETERGAGSTTPEVGQTFEVPDYCSWSVVRTRGTVELETSSSVKRARKGLTAPPGSALVTPAGGLVELRSGGRDATAIAAGGTRVSVDPKQCAAKAGWRLALNAGEVAVTAKAGPDAARDHDVATANATATGKVGAWSVQATRAGGAVTTVVVVRSGAVRVKGKAGAPVTVKAGFRTTVKGSAAPTAPARG